MQFAEAIDPEEAQALRRFVQTKEAERALEAKLQVISLTRAIELGGYEKRINGGLMPDSMLDGIFERPQGGLLSRSRPPTVDITPRLAIAPPKAQFGEIRLHYRGEGDLLFQSAAWERTDWERRIQIPAWSRFGRSERQWRASLPVLPKEARHAIERYPSSLVLWEADWDPTPVPLRDPAILVPLIKDLFAVAYVWDLTELEKRVLTRAFVE